MADTPLADHYRRWNQDEIVDRFATKSVGEFFESETRLLAPLVGGIGSVIDVGCASGRFVELLASLGCRPAYTGLDLSPASIARARQLYPGHAFHCANALDFTPGAPADLVNATGVVQHEPRFAELIDRMLAWSDRYVLFDAKLAGLDAHLADIGRAHVASEPPMFFVVLSAGRLLTDLALRCDITEARIHAYETPLNARVILPDSTGPVLSAGILLVRGTPGSGGPVFSHDIPESFLTTSL